MNKNPVPPDLLVFLFLHMRCGEVKVTSKSMTPSPEQYKYQSMRLLENVSGGGWTKWLVMLGRGAALGRVHPLQVSTQPTHFPRTRPQPLRLHLLNWRKNTHPSFSLFLFLPIPKLLNIP